MLVYLVALNNSFPLWRIARIAPRLLVSYYYVTTLKSNERAIFESDLFHLFGSDRWQGKVHEYLGEMMTEMEGFYDYDQLFKILKSEPRSLFVDSGAFSAANSGHKIYIEDYCRWLKQHSSIISAYANLDVIGDPEKSRKNLEYMQKLGLQPLPVFHVGTDFGVLKELASDFSYIALGGMVPLKVHRKKLQQFLTRCFSIVGEEVKVHGFGITAVWALETFPFYSVDSTAWLHGGIAGAIYRFDGRHMRFYKEKRERGKALKFLGYGARFLDRKRRFHLERGFHNIIEWLKYERFLSDLWRKRGVIWND